MALTTVPTPPLRLQLRLLKAPDDAAVFGADYQAELRKFKQHMEAAGLGVSPTVTVFDSQGAGSVLTGQFLLSWAPTVVSILNTVSVGAVTWINGKAGRQLRLKVDDVELEANSQAEIERLLAQALALQALLAEQDSGQ